VYTASGVASDLGILGTISGGVDLNEDGWDDLVFSSPNANSNTGEIYVSYGPHTGGSLDLSVHADLVLLGSGPGAYAGNALLVLDDISGDGVGDLLAFDHGSLYIASPTTSNTTGPITSIAHTVINHSSSVIHQGSINSTSEDWNDDGLEDLMLSDWYGGRLIFCQNPLVPGIYTYADMDLNIGGYGLGITDLNGDGNTDLFIQSNSNEIRFYEGPLSQSSISNGHTATLSDPNATVGSFGYVTNGLGRTIKGGDINGDGTVDLLVVDRQASVSHYRDGAIFVFLGPLTGSVTSADFTLSGSTDQENFGVTIQLLDIDGDGQVDVAARSQGSSPEATLFYGPLTSSLDTSAADASIPGLNTNSTQTSSGDLNADGYDDWLISVGGQVFLFLGAEN
jgi:hypothetical protein